MAARWIASPLAARPLNNLYAEQIEDVLEAWSDELSRNTLTHLRRVLGTALNEALRRKLILVNPVAGVRGPGRVQPTRVRTIRLGETVIRQLSDAWINHSYRLAFEVLVHTGLRPGELCGLDWSDINLKDLTLSVTRAVKSRRQAGQSPWYVGETKTASSARNIAFHEGLRPLFFQHYNAMGRPKSGWVFPSPRDPGVPITPDYLSKAFRELVDAARVSVRPGQERSELRIYDLRALHATHLIANEADPMAVAARLGHTDVVSTFRRYTGVVEGRDRVIADAGRVWETHRAPKELKAPKQGAQGTQGPRHAEGVEGSADRVSPAPYQPHFCAGDPPSCSCSGPPRRSTPEGSAQSRTRTCPRPPFDAPRSSSLILWLLGFA